MKTNYFNSLAVFNSDSSLKVDRENSILRKVRIADFGENKNGSFFDKTFLEDLVTQGNNPKGIKARFGHPNACSTSFGSYIGRYRDFKLSEVNGRFSVFADLHLDPTTKKTQVEGRGISMHEYILSMAENNSDMFGNSIHIYSQTFEQDIEGKTQTLHKLEKFKASDLVDDPAATDELFSNGSDLGSVVTSFLDSNPEIFSALDKNPLIIKDFFERYANYARRKSLNTFNMNFFENFSKIFSRNSEKFDIDLTLADGSVITVITESEEPQVNDRVVDSNGADVENGEHLLPDGGVIVTEGGIITEIRQAPTADPAAEPTPAEVMQAITDLGAKFSTFVTQAKKTQEDNEKAFELMAENLVKFQDATNLSLKSIRSSSYQAPGGEVGRGQGKSKESGYDADAVAEARKQLAERKK